MSIPDIVAMATLLAAGVCLTVGLASAFSVAEKRKSVINSVNPAMPPSPPGDGTTAPPVTNQSISTSIESVSKLAAALKDLDRVAQMFTLALGFTAVSAVAAGVDAIAEAIK